MESKFFKKKIKILKPLRGKKQGDIIVIKVDKNNIPIDLYWRRRFQDAKIDKCVEFLKDDKNIKINK